MTNWREDLLKIVRKTLRDGYLTEELDELIDEVNAKIVAACKYHVQSSKICLTEKN